VLEPVTQAIYKVPHVGPLLRTWPGRFIALVVVSQLLLPLHYYTVRRDQHDERFAWRMFSPMRMTTCEFSMTRDGQPVRLASEFHVYWIKAVEDRARFVVLEQMGAHLCRRHPGSEVKAVATCTYLDGKVVTYGGFDLCEIPEI
jgi:hypothetical protein